MGGNFNTQVDVENTLDGGVAGVQPSPVTTGTNASSSIDPNSLPPFPAAPPPGVNSTQTVQPPPPKPKFFLFRAKVMVLLFTIILVLAGAGGGYFYYMKSKTTYYTLLPNNSQFYLGLSVKKHPQVQKSLELGKRFPGGTKMINFLDDSRAELFGQRKDPFKEILKSAEDEIFLAKVSSDEPGTDVWAANPMEKLVNIVNFKGNNEAREAMDAISADDNVTTIYESYASAKIAKFELVEQDKDETSDVYKTGALPYMVTLPLSKSIFATTIENFIVSAEKDSDVKKIIDLVSKKRDGKLKSLANDKEHNEVVGHFPNETLVKFYQRQVLDPFSGVGLTSLPTNVFGGSQYDTRERESDGDNVFTVKRGFTIAANDRGFDLASYQLTDKSKISEGLKHGFMLDGSLASKLPSVYNSNNTLFWVEVKDLKGILKDQEDKFWDIAQNSSDKGQKEIYARSLDGMREGKEEFKKEFGLDVDEDILSWMTKQSAFFGTAGTRDKAPEALAVFEVDDAKSVLDKISKFKIKDYVKGDEIRRKSYLVRSDISRISSELQYGNSSSKSTQAKLYPATLKDLTTRENTYMKTLPKQQNGQDYGYLVCANGTEAIVWGLDETNGKYWAWVSTTRKSGYMDVAPPPPGCNVSVKSDDYNDYSSNVEYPPIEPKIEEYGGEKIHSYPIIDYKGDVFTFRFASAADLVVFSFGATDKGIKEIIDAGGKSTSPLSMDGRWIDQFQDAPKIVGSVFYAVPENIFGIIEYFSAKEKDLSYYATDDYMTIAKGYLKTIKSVGATTTQEGSTFITNTHLRVEAIGQEEATQVEKALDRVFFDKLDNEGGFVGNRSAQARDAKLKNDIGALATELQGYYTTPGEGKFPATLDVLLSEGYLKQMPKTVNGENYSYLTCQNFSEVVLWGKLEATDGYWVYRSASGRAQEEFTLPTLESCPKEVLGATSDAREKSGVFGLLDSIRLNISSPNK